jgi:flagellin
MASLLTNVAAMSALQVLRAVNKGINTASERLTTGQKINTAVDGAAYWAIATTLRSDNSVLSTVKSSLSLGIAAVDVALTGLSETLQDLGSLQERLIFATTPGADILSIQRDIEALQEKMRTDADSAGAFGQNWLSIDSSGNNLNWSRFASFTLGVPRDSEGITSIQSEQLDIASIALFDKNTVNPHKPLVYGDVLIDQIDRLAATINQSSLNSQVFAYRGYSDKSGSGTLYLQARELTKTITASFTDGDALPLAGVPVNLPIDRFGDLSYSYVPIPISSLSAGDTITIEVSGAAAVTVPVTTEGDGLDFTGTNEVHLQVRPFREKYPDVIYDVVVNGAVLAAEGVANLANVPHWKIVDEIAKQISNQYEANFIEEGPRNEIYVDVRGFTYSSLSFFVDASGPKSAVDVTVGGPTGGHSLIDIGYGTVAGANKQDLGYQEPHREPKGILDTTIGVPSSWRTDLSGIRVPIGYMSVSVAGPGTALSITPRTTQEQIQAFIQYVDKNKGQVMDVTSRLGSLKTLLTAQTAFVNRSSQILQSAIGTLVDADIEEESVRLKALQTQQQLAVQALSIANNNTQTILSLFRN